VAITAAISKALSPIGNTCRQLLMLTCRGSGSSGVRPIVLHLLHRLPAFEAHKVGKGRLDNIKVWVQRANEGLERVPHG